LEVSLLEMNAFMLEQIERHCIICLWNQVWWECWVSWHCWPLNYNAY